MMRERLAMLATGRVQSGRFEGWRLDDLQRHADRLKLHGAICRRNHKGCDCNRLYAGQVAEASAMLAKVKEG